MRIGCRHSFNQQRLASIRFALNAHTLALFTSIQLASLGSLAIYFDTNASNIGTLPPSEAIEAFSALVSFSSSLCNRLIYPQISRSGPVSGHQFILSPVSGQGKVSPCISFSGEVHCIAVGRSPYIPKRLRASRNSMFSFFSRT
jgi:hypothetical protein